MKRIKCNACGKFISVQDLADGKALHKCVLPSSLYSNEEFESLCSKCWSDPIHPRREVASQNYAERVPSSDATPAGGETSIWAEDCSKYPGCKCDDICLDSGGVALPSQQGKSP